MKKVFAGLIFIAGMVNAQTVQDVNSVPMYSNEINSGSARYMGMGGSMGALGGDMSAIEQNPAGAAVAIASDVNVTLGVDTYTNKTKFGSITNTKDNDFNFKNAAANLVFNTDEEGWNRFSIGMKFSYESLNNRINMDRNNKITKTEIDEENPDLSTIYTMNGYYDIVEGHKSKASLNFAGSYKDMLYLGLGVNFHEVNYSNYIAFDEDTNGTVYRYELNGTPYSVLADGVSLNAGVIGRPTEQLRLGLAYHSPVWYTKVQENFWAALPEGENQYNYDLFYTEYDRNSNGRLVASAGYVVGKSLALNADYTLHMNGSNKLKPGKYFTDTNAFFKDNLRSGSEIRLGGEYRYDKFRARLGYNYVQSPYKDINLDSDLGDGSQSMRSFSDAFSGDINRFSAGLGYDFGGFYLDFAYQFQSQKYKYVFGNAEYIDVDSESVYQAQLPLNAGYNYIADIDRNRGLFLLSMGWQF